MLRVGSEEIRAFCVLNDTSLGSCGGGGWTLVMKIDGKKVLIIIIITVIHKITGRSTTTSNLTCSSSANTELALNR